MISRQRFNMQEQEHVHDNGPFRFWQVSRSCRLRSTKKLHIHSHDELLLSLNAGTNLPYRSLGFARVVVAKDRQNREVDRPQKQLAALGLRHAVP